VNCCAIYALDRERCERAGARGHQSSKYARLRFVQHALARSRLDPFSGRLRRFDAGQRRGVRDLFHTWVQYPLLGKQLEKCVWPGNVQPACWHIKSNDTAERWSVLDDALRSESGQVRVSSGMLAALYACRTLPSTSRDMKHESP
jgi:hypothetical protein